MKTWSGCAILLVVSLVFAGCSESKPAEQPAKPEPTPQAVPRPADAPPNPEQTPTAQPEPAKPATVPQRPKQEPSASPAAEPPTLVPQTPKPAPKEEPKPEPTRTEPVKPAPPPPAALQKPAPPEPKKAVARDVVVLTGSPMGGVRLEHKLHTQRAGNTCTTCHHASKAEKPATAPQQACSDCHTKVAAAPMKTKYQAAFHNPTAQSGACIDCHKTENAKGKKAPLKCVECHKKENR